MRFLILFLVTLGWCHNAPAQLWHNQKRVLHYRPSGTDFVLHQGTKKFNRALYGTHTGFRVEAGDLPEFALYMPGMGGNCKIGIIVGSRSKWITAADQIKTTYRPGTMLYEIRDSLLHNGSLHITVLAMAAAEGMILKLETKDLPVTTSLLIAYGGATGKKFSRDGDIGADPESSFYLDPAYCKDNQYQIKGHRFRLYYGWTKPLTDDQRYEIQYGPAADSTKRDQPKIITGLFPPASKVKRADAHHQDSPLKLFQSPASTTNPVVVATVPVHHHPIYFTIQKEASGVAYAALPGLFQQAEAARKKIAGRVVLETPDPYINPLGNALAIAADAIWEAPSFLHGAVAWRMRLPAWRGAYAADVLGWSDRARLHFDSYLESQVSGIPAGPVEPDTALHFARQKERMGNAMFSNGYICRNLDGKIQPHHYDMNLVFIDQLLTHLKYTGDRAYLRKIWPALKAHLQWEKRNYDADNDGLYDAYACIWASDALQYSGGGVTHSTAYNYRAHQMAARFATLLNEDPRPYEQEAARIIAAMNRKLWLNEQGTFAEYIDFHGLQLQHPAPGLWTIYHAIDAGTATPLQQFRMLSYIDHQIPHIPVKAAALPFNDLELLATTNWQPYTWSINNVALAENLNTALAYWQGGAHQRAFQLWKSSIVESMYLSSSPGGFQQLSFYDAARGELYRDFADPIGVAARTLTEGLFGIHPDALKDTLEIHPGFPVEWKFARLSLPQIVFNFERNEHTTTCTIDQGGTKPLNLILRLKATTDHITAIYINGEKASFEWISHRMYGPEIKIRAARQARYEIKIHWAGTPIDSRTPEIQAVKDVPFQVPYTAAQIQLIDDPAAAFSKPPTGGPVGQCLATKEGNYSLLVHLKQGDARWIQPVSIRVRPALEVQEVRSDAKGSTIQLTNHTSATGDGVLQIKGYQEAFSIAPGGIKKITIDASHLSKGTNRIRILRKGDSSYITLTNWDVPALGDFEPADLESALNARVSQTFQHRYLEPRSNTTTLQIPWQGIGNWCYPLIQPEISESGIQGKTLHLDKIPFKIGTKNNIAYTSQWDNFPDAIHIPLSGTAAHAYLLMAGTTNHQQSQLTNGIIYIHYQDGSSDSLALINPKNWWPIEQDYMNDGFAFTTGPQPYRLILKTGRFTRSYHEYTTIKGFSTRAIEGGAATVLDIPLNTHKSLRSLTLKTLANEVVIGLMSLSLQRN